jgi:DNA-binding CsgD family transcriptional regulator
LERIYAERLQRLPATERQELLRAGLDGATAGRSDARAGGVRYPVPDAPVAVHEHLVRLDPASGAWTFAHPLLYAGGVTEAGVFRPYSHLAARSLWATVEAALHTGRDDAAASHVQAAIDLGLDRVSGRLAMLTDAARAVTEPRTEAADVLFRRASTAAAADEYPFDGARVRLAHGMWSRRQRRTTEARETLTRALDTFTALGAVAWQERTRQELRAAGTAARLPEATATLTAQERQVAELAAQGLSNKEIGARLFLSPRTVGAHLYRAYPKLGITSRASLRDALGAS